MHSSTRQETLKVVQRYSGTATKSTVGGILALVELGCHPFLLEALKQAISGLAYQIQGRTSANSEVVFSELDTENLEFDRTILADDRYQSRQAKVDEIVHEGRAAIEQLDCNDSTKQTLIEILECYAEKCRHCDPERSISQTQVARDLGLPKQTMNDYMKKLREVLESVRS